MATTLLTVFTLTSSIIVWIMCAVIIYSAYIFYKFRYDQALQKRYPPLVYLITISVVFYLGLSQSLMRILLLHKEGEYKGSGRDIIHFFDYFFYSFSVHGATIAIACRAWIMHFNINWSLQTKKAKWTVHISPKQVSSFWYIQHRKDYGSLKYIKMFAFTYYVSVGALLFIMWCINSINTVFDALFYLIECVSLTVIWYKMPEFADLFGIKSEVKYALRFGFFSFIAYVLSIVVSVVFSPDIAQMMYPIFMLCCYIGVTVMVLIFNSYIFWGKYKYLLSSKGSDLDIMVNIHDINDNDGSDSNINRLSNILQNEQSFEAFIEHLSEEFSVELLLSYIEFIQFKSLMKKDGAINVQNVDNENYIIHNLPVPQSHIVFESHENVSNHIGKYILIAIDLFNKYIDYSSEYEINISFAQRREVILFINQYHDTDNIDSLQLTASEQHKLYSLYDICIEEMYQLMIFSHHRFIRTARYTSINL